MAKGGQPCVSYKDIQTHGQDAINQHLSEECYPIRGVKGRHDHQDKKGKDETDDFGF
jgi:hypothetical protein